MEIIVSKKENYGTDKMEGEFHVPLSFGKGGNKKKWCCCISCKATKYINESTQGFICEKCKTYNGEIEKCEKLFVELFEAGELFNSNSPHITTSEMKDVVHFQDACNIRADMYSKGLTRQTLGSTRYRKVLSNELRKHNVKSKHFKY